MAQTAARGSDARHGSSTSTSLPYPPAPPSPTLTNPDMILPDYDRADSPEDRSQSPIMMWSNSQLSDLQYHLPPQNAFVAGPITPTTPIIYGNGTMLSDIGEVTEVESTVGRVSKYAASDRSDDDGLFSMPQTLATSRIKSRSQIMVHTRRSSIESTSTITTQERGATFTDFDDSASVDDSNFQGDDEESMASSYVDGTPAKEPTFRRAPIYQRPAEDRNSTYSLSQRAEEILANAKRRLTTMEGNLSRARGSLSQSSFSGSSTPSPPMVRPGTVMRDPIPLAGHSRNFSENVIPNSFKPTTYQRSASALGAAGGYRQPLTASKSAEVLGSRASRKFSPNTLDRALERLNEDEDDGNAQFQRSSPTFGSYPAKGLTRSASVAQMRDIKDQMNDLRGKISNLKEQARADSMKRQSLQSLRTPSPFTHARWDQGHMEPRGIRTPDLGNGLLQPPQTQEAPGAIIDGERRVLPVEEGDIIDGSQKLEIGGFDEGEQQLEQPVLTMGLGITQPPPDYFGQPIDDDVDDLRTEDGDVKTDQEEEWEQAQEHIVDQDDDQLTDIADSESESGDSLYHDTVQNSVSHEDREDAFDYEHFFLHSAMGTISQQRMERRGSTGSLSSEDSVETTKGPIPSLPRRSSVDTISSFDSFATAKEGRSGRSSAVPEGETKETVVKTSGVSSAPSSARPMTFDASTFNRASSATNHYSQPRRGSVIHRPATSTAVGHHRPSASMFDSSGTNRSFPLVNRAKMHGGILTPGGSPDHELKQISGKIMKDAAEIYDKDGIDGGHLAMQMLSKEDQMLVERLVAGLGKCVLGLSEGSSASSESRAYRRKMEAARRMLEGLDD